MELKDHRYFTYDYKGYFSVKSKCHVDIFYLMGNDDDDTIVLFSALQDNTGTSITNCSEQLATAIMKKYDLDVVSTKFIECYPYYDDDPLRYDLIRYKYDREEDAFYSPSWSTIKDDELIDFINENKSDVPVERA